MDGILLINKPKDWTSQDVCLKVKHLLRVKKIGHTGTLDPFATGLMVLTIGEATKLGQFIEGLDKTYVAKLELGESTPTGDTETEVNERKEIPNLSKDDIKKIFASFIGKQNQLPPMTSAIRVDGKKLYEYAHEGIEIERKPREIEIFGLDLLDFDGKSIIFCAQVSKGTYIRTLGQDIAKALGTAGYLSALERLKVGRYLLKNAINIENVSESKIISIDEALNFMDRVTLFGEDYKLASNGAPLKLDIKSPRVAIYNKENELIGIYENKNGTYYCLRGFNRENN